MEGFTDEEFCNNLMKQFNLTKNESEQKIKFCELEAIKSLQRRAKENERKNRCMDGKQWGAKDILCSTRNSLSSRNSNENNQQKILGGNKMSNQKIDYWTVKPAEQINIELKALPTAKEIFLKRMDIDEVLESHKGIVVQAEGKDYDNKLICIPTDEYKKKDHWDAFRPVVEGLTLSGVKDFEYSLWNDYQKASLSIYVGQEESGVKYGFKITNNYRAGNAINFGYNAHKKKSFVDIVEKQHVTLWTYRQICSNGAVIKVPLQSIKYLDAVTRIKVTELLSGKKSIIHTGEKMEQKLLEIQFFVEGLLLLKPALNLMIVDAQKYKLTIKEAELLLQKYIGQRKLDMYLQNFKEEEGNDLWTLFNSLTWYASHMPDISMSQRETLLDKAGTMLMEELIKVEN